MGHKTTTLTERADMVRINGKRLSELQYEGLNTPLGHEHLQLAQTALILMRAGYELFGHVAAKSEHELKAVLRNAHEQVMKPEGAKLTQAERGSLSAEIEAQVIAGMEELKQALSKYDLKPGMRVQHWDNLSDAA